MNILDYTYDLHRVEAKMSSIGLGKEAKQFISFLNGEFTKEELLSEVLELLVNLPELDEYED